MKICFNCAHENPEGELFCKRCGVGLGTFSLSTKKLDEDQFHARSEKLGHENIIFIYIQGYEDPVTLQVRDEAILGRGSSGEENLRLVDLDNFAADEKGVSRRHAILKRDGQRLFVADLGSTNSTFLNGQRLVENDMTLVHDGDEVMLGRLKLRFFFK